MRMAINDSFADENALRAIDECMSKDMARDGEMEGEKNFARNKTIFLFGLDKISSDERQNDCAFV